jgi:tetratricopeptide (TPR) repeat protein
MPKIAFLPFNVAEPIRPALGRQLAHFLSEAIKAQEGVETQFVSYLAQVGPETNPAAAFVNLGEELNPPEFVQQMQEQTGADFLVDGTIKEAGESFSLNLRVSSKDTVGTYVGEREFVVDGLFDTMQWLVGQVAEACAITLSPEFATKMEFGTDNARSFYDFLLGYDAVAYIQQTGGRVAPEFDVAIAFDSLLASVEADPDFLGAYESALQLAQLCAQFGIGKFEVVEARVSKLAELVPDDWRSVYARAGLSQAAGRLADSATFLEKAIRMLEAEREQKLAKQQAGEQVEVPNAEPALYTRLGLVQQQLNMFANAERSLKKAVSLEDKDKQSLDHLSNLLFGLGRGHEVPALWKEVVDADRTNGQAWGKYALALLRTGNETDARKAFEDGVANAESTTSPWVKRYFAPFLAQKGENDLAMDYYEDALEVAPEDVQTLFEYAQTLAAAGRQHEIPDVLNRILNAPGADMDAKANARAWQYELEQPKRTEALQRAESLMEKEEFGKAIEELEPLTTWMPEYWKPWALLATLYNRAQRFEDAERAATQLLQIFPGFEPSYEEYAAALAGQGRAEEAYQALAATFRVRPTPTVALSLARAAKQTGRQEEASRLAKMLREAAGSGNIEVERVLSEIEGS